VTNRQVLLVSVSSFNQQGDLVAGHRLLVKRVVIRFPVVGQQSRLIVEIQPAADKAIESLQSWLHRQ
jgi:hypothetical protein